MDSINWDYHPYGNLSNISLTLPKILTGFLHDNKFVDQPTKTSWFSTPKIWNAFRKLPVFFISVNPYQKWSISTHKLVHAWAWKSKIGCVFQKESQASSTIFEVFQSSSPESKPICFFREDPWDHCFGNGLWSPSWGWSPFASSFAHYSSRNLSSSVCQPWILPNLRENERSQ